ncbi:breast cancer type 1 susceptibility protein homolog [Amia ocellicauda]|uniref:breast cancer type 1 susceptibility protein homolog n=1 Tax=Amia ocellicauda TaxID=2972642 RepID=UPI00346431D0
MAAPKGKVEDVKQVLSMIHKNLQCPICLDLMKEPVSTKCDHQFCRFCMLKLLGRNRKNVAECPLCKSEVTKRSLQESPRFKRLVEGLLRTIHAFEQDTGTQFFTGSKLSICAPEKNSYEELREYDGVIQSTGYRSRAKRTTASNASKKADMQEVLKDGVVRKADQKTKKQMLESLVPLEMDSSEEDLLPGQHTTGSQEPACIEAQPNGFEALAGSSSCERLHVGLTDSGSWQDHEAAIPSPAAEEDCLAKLMDLDDASCLTNSGTAVSGSTVAVVKEHKGPADMTDFPMEPKPNTEIDLNLCSSKKEREPNSTFSGKASKDGKRKSGRSNKKSVSTGGQDCLGKDKNSGEKVKGGHSDAGDHLQEALGLAKVVSDKIVEKRRRRSIQKVSEWLSGIDDPICSSGLQNSEDGADFQLEECDSEGDSTETQKYEEVAKEELDSLKKTDRRTSLENQIFGVVYRRDRKSDTQVNKSISSDDKRTCDPPSSKERQVDKKASKRKSNELTPADFIKRPPALDDKSTTGEQPLEGKDQQCPAKSDNASLLSMEGENDKRKESPSFDFTHQTIARAEKADVRASWKNIKDDMPQECTESTGKKNKSNRRDSVKKSASTTKKATKAAKSLELVTCQLTDDHQVLHIAGPQELASNEKEVQIESYPSSEDPASAIIESRAIRRSRRLQLFTEEVQATSKRLRSETAKFKPYTSAEAERVFEGFENEQSSAQIDQGRTQMVESTVLQQADKISAKQVGELKPNPVEIAAGKKGIEQHLVEMIVEKSSQISMIPNTESPQTSSNIIDPAPPTLEISAVPDTGADVMVTNDLLCAELAEGKNDSELDTEQLLKTFKTTKRRSFNLLPSPDHPPQENRQSEDQVLSGKSPEEAEEGKDTCERNPTNSEKQSERCCVAEFVKSPGSKMDVCASLKQVDLENFGGSDVIPPTVPVPRREASSQKSKDSGVKSHSLTKGQVRTRSCSRAAEFGECSDPNSWKSSDCSRRTRANRSNGNCTESVEVSPLGKARRTRKSLNQFPSVSDSGLLFSETPEDHQNPTTGIPATKESMVEDGKLKRKTLDSSAGDGESDVVHSFHMPAKISQESSMTPDGLLPPHFVVDNGMCDDGQGQMMESKDHLSQQSPAAKPRKRRRAQRLESSDSDSSFDEELVPLAVLFGSKRPPGLPQQDPSLQECGFPDKMATSHVLVERSAVIMVSSQDSFPGSQTSVDLFSTQWGHSSQLEQVTELSRSAPLDRCSPVNSPNDSCHSVEENGADNNGHLEGKIGEAAAYDREASHPVESPLLSSQSEILTTQQKDTMQKDLRRLEQEMALLEAALKEQRSPEAASPARKSICLPPNSQGTAATGEKESRDRRNAAVCVRMESEGTSSEGETLRSEAPKQLPVSPVCLLAKSKMSDSEPVASSLQPEQKQMGSRAKDKKQEMPGRLSVTKLRNGSTRQSGSDHVCENLSPSLRPQERDRSMNPPGWAGPAAQEPGRRQPQERPAPSAVTTDTRDCRSSSSGRKMSFVASGLNRNELMLVQKFAKKMESTLSSQVNPGTTHVIMKTDGDLVCERTLKYFLGIAGKKWVVSHLWIVECFRQGQVLDEAKFEVRGDVINGRSHQGPRRARTSGDEKLLLSGYEICCYGSFTDMTGGQLEWMVELCGATVAKEPFLFTYNPGSTPVIVVQPDSEESQKDYRALKRKYKASVVTREWVLDSVALYSCQSLGDYLLDPLQ